VAQRPRAASAADIDAALGKISDELGDKHYYNLQARRYKWVLERVCRHLPPGARVADIGSAPGHTSMALADLGYEVTAFDFAPDEDMWESTPQGSFAGSLRKRNIALKHWDVEVVDPGSVPNSTTHGEFDCVIFTEVLEHVYRYPFATVRQLAHLLKPGGIMVITTPNRTSLTSRLKALLGYPYDTSLNLLMDHFPPHMRHVWVYSPSEVATVVDAAGMDVVESSVNSFHLWTTKISVREILPYWRPTNLKQILKPCLALFLLFLPSMGESVCCIGKKRAK
jgi:SAM-dependent methyltransferase